MGIPKLWNTMLPTANDITLLELSITQGYSQPRGTYIIGVDTSAWLDSAQAAFQKATIHTHSGENPELRAIFFKLCSFLQAPITLVFVFDGPHRPRVKHGKNVRTTPSWMIAHLETLIRAFGFYSHKAPGEAEAELAKLNSLGYIDAVLTDDSDTFVFGAKTIIRSSTVSSMLMASSRIYFTGQTNDQGRTIGLTEGGLLLYAVLVGGDYSKGLRGCGPRIARLLIRLGYGDSLLGITQQPTPLLRDLLDAWRTTLAVELQHNHQQRLPRLFPQLAKSVLSSEFKLLEDVRAYQWPVTSWSLASNEYPIPIEGVWRVREPLPRLIANFCTSHLGWGNPQVLAKKFSGNLWAGMAMREASSILRRYDAQSGKLATPYGNFTILSERRKQPSNLAPNMPLRRITITTNRFSMLCEVPGLSEHHPNEINVTIPSAILDPMLVPSLLSRRNTQLLPQQQDDVIDLTAVSEDEGIIDLTGDDSESEDEVNHFKGSEIIELTDSE